MSSNLANQYRAALREALERADRMYFDDDEQQQWAENRERLYQAADMEAPTEDQTVTLVLTPDVDGENPFDDLPAEPQIPVMACAHGRYELGTKDGMGYLINLLDELQQKCMEKFEDDSIFTDEIAMPIAATQYENHQEIIDTLETKGMLEGIFITPLYLYDHSGLSISTLPFDCPWDSGQVGYVVMDYRESGTSPEMAGLLCNTMVERYNVYLTQGLWHMTLTRGREEIASIGGFVGNDPTDSDNSMIDYIPEELREEAFQNMRIEY